MNHVVHESRSVPVDWNLSARLQTASSDKLERIADLIRPSQPFKATVLEAMAKLKRFEYPTCFLVEAHAHPVLEDSAVFHVFLGFYGSSLNLCEWSAHALADTVTDLAHLDADFLLPSRPVPPVSYADLITALQGGG
jgi:glycine/D-amino acid oxidase-like deaminating enzyme